MGHPTAAENLDDQLKIIADLDLGRIDTGSHRRSFGSGHQQSQRRGLESVAVGGNPQRADPMRPRTQVSEDRVPDREHFALLRLSCVPSPKS